MSSSQLIKSRTRSKLTDYSQLIKLNLSALVVFSAVIGYLFAAPSFDPLKVSLLIIAGLLVTGASNAINEILERDTDKLMDRTSIRPLPAGRMSLIEAILFAGITGILGILMFTYFFNPITGVLAAVSLLLYAFLYTPLKKVSSVAVFIGAIPGALPPTIGYVAYANQLDQIALILFGLQFIWQFAHFWAIAWVSYNDYKKADIMLLPDANGKTKLSAFYTFLYTIVLVPLAFVPYVMNIIGLYGTLVILGVSVYFAYTGFMFFLRCDDASAKKVMFGSFFYLPITQLSILIDKI